MSVSFTGLTPSNLPTNTRAVIDANYVKTIALPSAAGSVYSASLDLGDGVSGVPYATTETINVQVLAPALADAVIGNAETIAYALQDSADNSSFAAIAALATQTQTGAGAGVAATTYTFKLPPNTRRYIRLAATTGASTGDASGSSATLRLAF